MKNFVSFLTVIALAFAFTISTASAQASLIPDVNLQEDEHTVTFQVEPFAYIQLQGGDVTILGQSALDRLGTANQDGHTDIRSDQGNQDLFYGTNSPTPFTVMVELDENTGDERDLVLDRLSSPERNEWTLGSEGSLVTGPEGIYPLDGFALSSEPKPLITGVVKGGGSLAIRYAVGTEFFGEPTEQKRTVTYRIVPAVAAE